MAILTATVKSQRVVSGEYKTGKRQGEEWEFLSLELIDVSSGFIWNCQLPSEDETYRDATKDTMVGHRVQASKSPVKRRGNVTCPMAPRNCKFVPR